MTGRNFENCHLIAKQQLMWDQYRVFRQAEANLCRERDKLSEGLGYHCLHGVGFFKLLHMIRAFIQVMVIWGVHVIFLARIWFQYIMLYYSKLNLCKIGVVYIYAYMSYYIDIFILRELWYHYIYFEICLFDIFPKFPFFL